MKKKPEGFLSMPLWQKGLFLILIGPLVNMVSGFVFPIVGNSEAAHGQRFGQGLVAVLCVIAGVVLMIIHFVRGNRDTTDRNAAKLAKSKTGAPSVRSAGKSVTHRSGNYKAIGWSVLGLGLVIGISVLFGLFIVAGNTTDVPRSGPGANDNPNSMKPRKSYPVTIGVPADSQVVPADAKLKPGTRLQACWSGKWNPITLLSENQDGNLTVRWDDFGASYDCSMLREELIVKTDILKASQASP